MSGGEGLTQGDGDAAMIAYAEGQLRADMGVPLTADTDIAAPVVDTRETASVSAPEGQSTEEVVIDVRQPRHPNGLVTGMTPTGNRR